MIDEPNAETGGRGSLRDRATTVDPPAALEARIRRTLTSRRLVHKPTRSTSAWVVRAGLIAAGMLIGALAQRPWVREPVRPSDQPGQYVLLLLGDTQGDTGAVHVAREREYGQWASSLDGGARWVGGHELGDVVDDIGPKATGAPALDRLAGYFVIDAPSRERAAEVARTCPHVKYGGRVVVMAIAS